MPGVRGPKQPVVLPCSVDQLHQPRSHRLTKHAAWHGPRRQPQRRWRDGCWRLPGLERSQRYTLRLWTLWLHVLASGGRRHDSKPWRCVVLEEEPCLLERYHHLAPLAPHCWPRGELYPQHAPRHNRSGCLWLECAHAAEEEEEEEEEEKERRSTSHTYTLHTTHTHIHIHIHIHTYTSPHMHLTTPPHTHTCTSSRGMFLLLQAAFHRHTLMQRRRLGMLFARHLGLHLGRSMM